MFRTTRRQLLKALTAMLSTAAVSAGAAPDTSLRLGFSLYGMKDLPLAAALKTCAEIGYQGVELPVMAGWSAEPAALSPSTRADLRKELADLGLGLPALMENLVLLADEAGHQANLERLKHGAELAHALAPDAPPVIETTLGGKPAEWEAAKARMAERLSEWARVAETAKITLAVKPHVGGALHTPEGALWLLEQVRHPRLRLAYDYSHFQLRGRGLAETVRALVPHSVFIHVKDARGTAEQVEFLLPGDAGTVDYAEYLKQVRAAGYRGYMVVEVSAMLSRKPGYDPVAAARRSYANLAPAFR